MADKYYIHATLIQLDPATVWLCEESPGNRAFFPDEHNTRFVFSDDVGILIIDLVAVDSPMNIQSHSPTTSSAKVLPTSSEPSTSGLSHQTHECKEDSILQCQNYPSLCQASIKWETRVLSSKPNICRCDGNYSQSSLCELCCST